MILIGSKRYASGHRGKPYAARQRRPSGGVRFQRLEGFAPSAGQEGGVWVCSISDPGTSEIKLRQHD